MYLYVKINCNFSAYTVVDVGDAVHHTLCGVVRTVDRNYIGQMRKMFAVVPGIKWRQPNETHEAEETIACLVDTGKYDSWSKGVYHHQGGAHNNRK